MYKKFKILLIGLLLSPFIKSMDESALLIPAIGFTYTLYRAYVKAIIAKNLKKDPYALIAISLNEKFSQDYNLIKQIIKSLSENS